MLHQSFKHSLQQISTESELGWQPLSSSRWRLWCWLGSFLVVGGADAQSDVEALGQQAVTGAQQFSGAFSPLLVIGIVLGLLIFIVIAILQILNRSNME